MSMERLVLYKGFEKDKVFWGVMGMVFQVKQKDDDGNIDWIGGEARWRESFCNCVHELVERSVDHGFEGNLWQAYLTFLLVSHENAYSKACERRGAVAGSVNELARSDFSFFLELFRFDFGEMARILGVPHLGVVMDYQGDGGSGGTFSHRIRDSICELSVRLGKAEDAEGFQREITEFYREFGVGDIGLHKAFRVERKGKRVRIVPISKIAHVHLDDLVGYEDAKRKLVENTEAFVKGRQANNCLLFGDAGTGKSTSIKAIINQYYGQGLRMIELYKHQFKALNDVIAQVKNRNYRFIIYMDDLSFEEFEIEYKYLKAVMEGGLERKPDNVLIYATSNRRHLVREKFSDKQETDDELHTRDTVQEKLSLASRFGASIYFGAPDKKEYEAIVRGLAKRNGIRMDEDALLLAAERWELGHGGRSGRTAQQFVNDLLGKEQA